MKVKLIRLEQEKSDLFDVENSINKELEILISKNPQIKDIKLSVVRDVPPEHETSKSYALTVMIIYE